MGRYLTVSIPILVLAATIEASFIRVFLGGPELVMLCVLAWAVNGSLEESVTWAFVGGIASDLLSAAPTGTTSLGLIILVFVISRLDRQVYRVGFFLILSLVIFATTVQFVTSSLILVLAGFRVDLLNSLSYVFVPTVGYNLVAIWPVAMILRRIQRWVRDDRVFAP